MGRSSLLLLNVLIAAEPGLEQLYRLDELARLKTVVAWGMVSSYDRTGANDDGFSGKYSFIRKEGDSLVVADLEGPGVIYRVWTPTPTDDPSEIQVDGEVRHKLKFSDLFTGRVAPFLKPLVGSGVGGFYSYVPIVYQKSCKILVKTERFRFYQINWARYGPDTLLKPADGETQARAMQAIGSAGKDISSLVAPAGSRVMIVANDVRVTPGGKSVLFQSRRGGRIVGLRLSSQALQRKDRSLVLRAWWDEETAPAIDVPAGDLFGHAWGRPAARALFLGSDNGVNYLYLPMPYDRSARVELVNEGSQSVEVRAEVLYCNAGRQPGEARLYALWRREKPLKEGQPFTFADIKGEGHVIGVILQAQGDQPGDTNFFEGDDQAIVDGELTAHGTGSEDFFNGGWYDVAGRWESRGSFPLSGCLGYFKPLGRTGAYRFFLGDAYSFRKSLRLTIEHGPAGNKYPGDYAAVTLLYAKDRPEGLHALGPAAERAVDDPRVAIFHPGFSLPVHAFSYRNATLRKAVEKTDQGSFRYLSLEGEGDDVFGQHFIAFLTEAPAAGQYRVSIEAMKGPEQSGVQMFRDESPIGPVADFTGPKREKSTWVSLGMMEFTEGQNQLLFKLGATTSQASKRRLDLVRIALERLE